jgi:hypothetical protein
MKWRQSMAPSSDITEFRKVLESSKNIIVLSGAGLSAPSGIIYRTLGIWGHIIHLQQHLLRYCDLSRYFGIPVVKYSKYLCWNYHRSSLTPVLGNSQIWITDAWSRNQLAQTMIHSNYFSDVLTLSPTMGISPSLHWTFHLLWNVSLLLPPLPHCTSRKI